MNVFSYFVDFGHVLAPFSWYTILRYRDALEQVFRWKFKFVRIYHIKICSFFAYSKHLFFCAFFFPWHFNHPSNKEKHKGVALKASWRGIEHVVFPKWSSGVLHQVVLLALDDFSWCTRMHLENWPFDIKVCWNWNLGVFGSKFPSRSQSNQQVKVEKIEISDPKICNVMSSWW